MGLWCLGALGHTNVRSTYSHKFSCLPDALTM